MGGGGGANFTGVGSQFFWSLMMRKFGTHPLSQAQRKCQHALWSCVGAKYPFFIHQRVLFGSKFSSVTWLHTIGNFCIGDWQTPPPTHTNKNKIKNKNKRKTNWHLIRFLHSLFTCCIFYVSYHSSFIMPTKQRKLRIRVEFLTCLFKIPVTGVLLFSLSIIPNHEIQLSIASLHEFQLHR